MTEHRAPAARGPEVKTPPRLAVLAAFAGIYLIWGSTYLAILFAIRSIPPLLMAGTRFLLAGVIWYAGARLLGEAPSSRADWRTALIVGAMVLLLIYRMIFGKRA